MKNPEKIARAREIGPKAKAKRLELGFSATDFARSLDITPDALCHLEAGRRSWDGKLGQRILARLFDG